MYEVNIYENVRGFKLSALLNMVINLSDEISLERNPNHELSEEEMEGAKEDYYMFIYSEDKKRRDLFMNDPDFNRNMLEIFGGNRSRVEKHFDDILKKDLENIEDMEDDFEDFESEDGYFDIFDYDGTDLIGEEELNSLLEDFIDDEDFVEYPSKYWLKGEFNGNSRDFLRKKYTFVTNTIIGSLYELVYFKKEKVGEALKLFMDSLFSWPILYQTYLFENPSFIREGRVILSISSKNKFATMTLTDREYEYFKDLNIDHTFEKI